MTDHRKRMLRHAVRFVVYPLLALAVYMVLIEPNWIKITEYDLTGLSPAPRQEQRPGKPSPAATSPTTAQKKTILIAHLSDFHMDGWMAVWRVERVARMLRASRPDLIVMTGDFFSGKPKEFAPLLAALRQFPPIAPCYATAGNHDGGLWVKDFGGYESTAELETLLNEAGIRLLRNETIDLTVNGRQLQIYGAGDLWAGDCFPPPPGSFRAEDGKERIILTHNPDSRTTFAAYPWKLMLSGHTHGGQIVLPWVGAPILPVRDRQNACGLRLEPTRALIVSTGVGNLKEIRLNCRPEVVLVRF